MSSLVRALTRSLTAAAALAIATAAQAVVIVDQAPDATGVLDGWLALEQQNADDFTTDATWALSSIEWWGFYFGVMPGITPADDAFSVQIYESLDATPTSLPIAGTFARSAEPGSVNDFGEQVFRYELSLASALVLDAGLYYISVANQSFEEWYWGADFTFSSNWFQAFPGDNWVEFDTGDFFFRINGDRVVTVAEPGTFGLALLGLLAFAYRRRMSSRPAR